MHFHQVADLFTSLHSITIDHLIVAVRIYLTAKAQLSG
jgi:hypothetical protein